MGLDNFIQDGNSDEEEITVKSDYDLDKDVNEEISHLVNQMNGMEKGMEDVTHYNSKIKAAISLARHDYFVYIEYNYIEDTNERADVYAVYDEDTTNTHPEDIEYQELIVEVGKYSASRAKNALKEVDCIIMIPKGGTLDDGMIVTSNDFISSSHNKVPIELMETLNDNVYQDIGGVPFVPEVENLYVETYKDIATVMVDNLTDVSDMSRQEVVEKVNDSTDRDYSNNDILKVADEVGFI